MRAFSFLGLVAALALAACGDDSNVNVVPDAGPDSSIIPVAPTQVSMVAQGGFEEPMDAVASPDGNTFYFSAHNPAPPANAKSTAAIYRVPSAGGTPEILVQGLPLEDPTGLLMSCDGKTLYIADLSYQTDDAQYPADAAKSPIYVVDLDTSILSPLPVTGIGEATGLAFNTTCSTLYVTGYTPAGVPAVFTLAPEGGTATVLKQGAPLERPSGLYVDKDDTAWVMDQRPSTQLGGLLWAIKPAGDISPVVENLRLSEPAGCSLVAGGGIAVIPSRNADNIGQLITVNTETAEMGVLEAPMLLEPAGIRAAIYAPVLAVVDAEGNAIYSAR